MVSHPEPVRPTAHTPTARNAVAPTPQQQDLAPPPGAAVSAAKRDKVHVGEVVKKAVDKLRTDLGKHVGELKLKLSEPTDFGLGFDVFDPETGLMFSAARADRRDGLPATLMTVDEVVEMVVSARRHAETAGEVTYVDQLPKAEPADTKAV